MADATGSPVEVSEAHEGRVARLVLNAPPGNALDLTLAEELPRALAAIARWPALTAVVIEGAGSNFATGSSGSQLRPPFAAALIEGSPRSHSFPPESRRVDHRPRSRAVPGGRCHAGAGGGHYRRRQDDPHLARRRDRFAAAADDLAAGRTPRSIARSASAPVREDVHRRGGGRAATGERLRRRMGERRRDAGGSSPEAARAGRVVIRDA